MNAPLLARSFAMLTGVRPADMRDPGERARIDGFVRDHPRATPFHLTGWTAAVERGTGRRGHYLLAEHADGRIVGVLPLTESRSRRFGCALVSAGFAGAGGVLAETPAAADALADAAWAMAQRLGCATLDLRGGLLPRDWTIDDTSFLSFARDLAADDAAELAAIPPGRRAAVREAMTMPFRIAIGASPRALREHYRMYAASMRGSGAPVLPFRLMRAVADAFGDEAEVLIVRHEGRPMAGVFSLYFRGTVHPCWAGDARGAAALSAVDAMYFALMAHARSRGGTRFDFGRSGAGTAAAAFREDWGFVPEPSACAVRRIDGGDARVGDPSDPRRTATTRAWLPLPLTNVVAPWIGCGPA